MKKYESLKQYCQSLRQVEILTAVIECGSILKAARNLNIRESSVRKTLKRVEKYAACIDKPPPGLILDSHYVKKTATRYKIDEEGNTTPTVLWVSTNAKLDSEMQALREFTEAMVEECRGKADIIKQIHPAKDKDILTLYPLVDPHIGMFSWKLETGADYGVEIARKLLKNAADRLITNADPSHTCVIANLGDFFHYDTDDKRTKRGGAVLDGDGRSAQIVRVGVWCLKYWVNRALQKHKFVKVINSIGNHDDQTSQMLALILEAFYENVSRVEIETAPQSFHYHRFGANFLGFHHGHDVAMKDLPGLMATDRRKDWGEAEFCHWITGHIHHESKEYPGCLVESFRTLASQDFYNYSKGHRSLRDIQSLTYHRLFGETGRQRVSLKMLES